MIIILILLLILLYLLLNHKENFIVNPTLFFKGSRAAEEVISDAPAMNEVIKKMREYRDCNPSDEGYVSCILSKNPIFRKKSSFYPRFVRKVNYMNSQNVRDLMPIKKPI